MAQELVRSRASKPKVRTGCLTCKIRHVKCDEGKPHCQRCITTGRICDGYLTSLSRKPRSSATSTSSLSRFLASDSNALSCRNPAFDISGDILERESFHFFQTTTSSALSGFFINSFWNTFLLQASHQDDAIKHAVVALGSMHQGRKRADGPAPSEQFALRQYNKSIQKLLQQQRSGESPTENALAASVLYAFFEIFRGDEATAIKHMVGGLSIFYDTQLRRAKDPNISTTPISMNGLASVFSHLDIQATELTGPLPYHGMLHASPAYMNKLPEVPDSFKSLEEAKDCYIELEKLDLHFHVSLGEYSEEAWQQEQSKAKRRSYELLYEKWLSSFTSFLTQNSSKMDANALKGAIVLKIHHILSSLSSRIDPATFDMVMDFDRFESEMEQIVSMASSLLTSTIPGRLEYTTDLGIVEPLYVVAVRCRDPIIRRRAIHLLKEYPRLEGIWDGRLAGWVSEWTMEVEEDGLVVNSSADIPDWARVSVTNITFPEERMADLEIVKGRSKEGGTVLQRTYEW